MGLGFAIGVSKYSTLCSPDILMLKPDPHLSLTAGTT